MKPTAFTPDPYPQPLFDISSQSEVTISSPGRINLIGEHIDYNGGHVLPGAIELYITLYLRKNHSKHCRVYSNELKKGFRGGIEGLKPSPQAWENHILGVVDQIGKIRPSGLGGFDCIISSDLPRGSGLSSSAALECGLAAGLNKLFSFELSELDIIRLAQRAEHGFVGTQCGIMDQFAVVKGEKDKLIYLNSNTLEYELIKARFAPYELVLLNSNVSHSLASSEYNQRRAECEAALEAVRLLYPEYRFLADIPLSLLSELKGSLNPVQYQRTRYVIEENSRVKQGVELLKAGLLPEFGQLLYESHQGLKELYEVSCGELDFLVAHARTDEAVIGARLMGGGFGGCTINLIHKEWRKAYVKRVASAYKKEFQRSLHPIPVSLGNGLLKRNNNTGF